VEEMRRRYMREIATLEDDIEELEHKLETERTAHNDTRDRLTERLTERERELHSQMTERERELQSLIAERDLELGRAQGKLDTLAQQDIRQTRLWLAVIVGALLAAGGIGALVAFLLSSGG
ncbi:MAG: hypothetical protein AAF653_21170, partial [Chloroflexota bacterium]